MSENEAQIPTFNPGFDFPEAGASPSLDLVPAIAPSHVAPPASRRFSELELHIIRELSPEDLLEAYDGTEVSGPTSLGSIRHAHHRLAMLVCEGKSPSAISLITGYSPGYISRLQGDPMFRELLAHYGSQVEDRHVDVMDRLQTLGLTAVEELQGRLETEPEKFTKAELQGLAKLALVDTRTGASPGGPASSGPSVALNVQFVTPQTPGLPPAPLDITPRKIAPENEI